MSAPEVFLSADGLPLMRFHRLRVLDFDTGCPSKSSLDDWSFTSRLSSGLQELSIRGLQVSCIFVKSLEVFNRLAALRRLHLTFCLTYYAYSSEKCTLLGDLRLPRLESLQLQPLMREHTILAPELTLENIPAAGSIVCDVSVNGKGMSATRPGKTGKTRKSWNQHVHL